MNEQTTDELLHDICVRFFPEDEETREELENVLQALIVENMRACRKEFGVDTTYKPEDISHG